MDANFIDQAKQAIQQAEAEFNSGNVLGALNLAHKAKQLFPNLDGLAAHLECYRIHSAFDSKSPDRTDWYAVLDVKHGVDLELIRKRFKELRALTHPDKNTCSAADGAFKLVYEAWESIYKYLGNTSNDSKRDAEEEKEEGEEDRRNSASMEKSKCPDCSPQCGFILINGSYDL